MALNKFETVGDYLSQTQDTLTDSSGGSANTTIAEITNSNNSGSADVEPTADAIADLAAQLAKVKTDIANIIAALNGAN